VDNFTEGIDLDYLVMMKKYPYKSSSLFLAVRNGDLMDVRRLLKAGMNPDMRDIFRQTPLHYACYNGDIDIVKELLTAPGGGADPDAVDAAGETPLHRACINRKVEVVKLLLLYGADPAITDMNGVSPLHVVIDEKMWELVELMDAHFLTLRMLSIRSIRNHKINIRYLPDVD